jgi:hypothetical protein
MSSLWLGTSRGCWPARGIWMSSCSMKISRLGVAMSSPQKDNRTPLSDAVLRQPLSAECAELLA